MQLLICSVRARDELFILRLIKKLSIEATRSIFHARFHCFSSRLAPRSSLTRFNISAREQFRCVSVSLCVYVGTFYIYAVYSLVMAVH